ncbi:MAG: DUF4129 domain-containing protein [Pirellulales bacterium]|nr:DUF4129 domain-containing protein [Pirellulales bacterium]
MIHFAVDAATVLVTAAIEPDESIARGRESLDRWWGGYPWYDSATDSVKPIEIPELPKAESDWNWDWLDFDFPLAAAEFLKWGIWTLLIVLVVVLVYFLLRAYFRDGNLRWAKGTESKKAQTDLQRRLEALPFAIKATKLDFLDEARRYYEQGQYGDAVKYLFSYQLVELDKHRVVRLTRGKTNRQYVREVGRAGRAPLSRVLEQTMLVFEDFFFGNHPIDRVRFEACWSRLPEFEAQLTGETA